MYRDPVMTAKSCHRLSMVRPSLRLAYLLSSLSGRITKTYVDAFGADGSNFCVRLDNDLTGGVLRYAMATISYRDMRRRGYDISALRYEDLIARPLDMCRILLEFCNLPVSLAEVAVKAFGVDSQRNSTLSKSVMESFKELQLTPQTKAKLNQLLKKCGIPLIGETHILEGTLSCSPCSFL